MNKKERKENMIFMVFIILLIVIALCISIFIACSLANHLESSYKECVNDLEKVYFINSSIEDIDGDVVYVNMVDVDKVNIECRRKIYG